MLAVVVVVVGVGGVGTGGGADGGGGDHHNIIIIKNTLNFDTKISTHNTAATKTTEICSNRFRRRLMYVIIIWCRYL